MIYKHKKFSNGTIVINGFKDNNPSYVMGVTLIPRFRHYSVHSLVSKERMLKQDLKNLFNYMSDNIKSKVLTIEAVIKHAVIYKKYLPVISSKKTKTYSGFDSETLVVDLRKKI